MSDTMEAAIQAAEAFLADSKTPKQQGKRSTPTRTDEWLRWHRHVVARADGNRSRLMGCRLRNSSPEELQRGLELIEVLQAISEKAQADARALEPRARL